MTGQISDRLTYEGTDYRVTRILGHELYDPHSSGVILGEISTGCRRGYHCGYTVIANTLFLTRLNLGLWGEDEETAARGTGPVLFGKIPQRYVETTTVLRFWFSWWPFKVPWRWIPTRSETRESSDWRIDGIQEPMRFTGRLLVGDDIIREIISDFGFQAGFKYRVVYELIFSEGRLRESHDRSADASAFRQAIATKNPALILDPEWIIRYFAREAGANLRLWPDPDQ